MKRIFDTSYKTKFHRDGTVTIWDVYQQVWRRTAAPSDHVLASLPKKDRDRAIKHCKMEDSDEC